MRNKSQARDRRRSEVEDEMELSTIAHQLNREPPGPRRLALLFAWLEAFSGNGHMTMVRIPNPAWRQMEKVIDEIRAQVGNGPAIQTATWMWLSRAIHMSLLLARAPALAPQTNNAVTRFISSADDEQRLAPLDLDTYERWLGHAHIPGDKLEALRTAYWELLTTIATHVSAPEADSLRDRTRRHIAAAYGRGVRDCEDERGYRSTCKKLGLDPGPAWTQTPREVLFV